MNMGDEEAPSIIPCRVCGSMVDISTKRDQHVVKCEYCHEATPIRNPPQGQKYIRCPCNCLLICKSTAQRISCPRPTCRKIIVLYSPEPKFIEGYTPKPEEISPVPGMCRVNCGHCGEIFLFNSLVNQLARCPHCERKSSVGRGVARARGYISLFISLLALSGGIIMVFYRPSWAIVYVLLFLLALFCLYKSVFYLTMKNSTIIDGSDNQS